MSHKLEIKERPRSYTIWMNGQSICSMPKTNITARKTAYMILDALKEHLDNKESAYFDDDNNRGR